MYFLIVYDRGTGEKVDMLTFASDREEEARDERFGREPTSRLSYCKRMMNKR